MFPGPRLLPGRDGLEGVSPERQLKQGKKDAVPAALRVFLNTPVPAARGHPAQTTCLQTVTPPMAREPSNGQASALPLTNIGGWQHCSHLGEFGLPRECVQIHFTANRGRNSTTCTAGHVRANCRAHADTLARARVGRDGSPLKLNLAKAGRAGSSPEGIALALCQGAAEGRGRLRGTSPLSPDGGGSFNPSLRPLHGQQLGSKQAVVLIARNKNTG